MNFKDQSLRLASIESMHYSSSGLMVGIVVEKRDGSKTAITMSDTELRRFMEMLLNLSKEAARAPEAKPHSSRGWTGQPLDLDAASLLNLSTATHATVGLSFGLITLGVRAPRLLWATLLADMAPAAPRPASRKRQKPN